MKYLISIILLVSGCTLKPKVKEEVKSLQNLKTECDNLQVELEAIGAKKWTKVIDDKVKACKDHGFWEFRKSKVRDFTEGL